MREISKLVLASACLTLISACAQPKSSVVSTQKAAPAIAATAEQKEEQKTQKEELFKGTLDLKPNGYWMYPNRVDVEMKIQSPLDASKELLFRRAQFAGIKMEETKLYQRKGTETATAEASMQCVEAKESVCDLAAVTLKVQKDQETVQYVVYFQRDSQPAQENETKPLVPKYQYRASEHNPGSMEAAVLNIPALREAKLL